MTDYMSLVARSGQVNTPPGSYKTVKEWIHHSFLGPQSRVCELGCSNGFITIEIARYVQATCCGIDLHAESVAAARVNIDRHVANNVSFHCGDAGNLIFPDHSFSHVVIGGHLPFIPPAIRLSHVTEAVRITRPWGYLLTALYFYTSPPPKNLVDEFNRAVGTKLEATHDVAYWSNLFERQTLVLEYESLNEVLPADSTRTQTYLRQLPTASRKRWRQRLALFNENGKYLSYFVRVYRRLPEDQKFMIQVPRGGLYHVKRRSFGHR